MLFLQKLFRFKFLKWHSIFVVSCLMVLGFGYWACMFYLYPSANSSAFFSFRPWGDFTYQPFIQQVIHLTFMDLNETFNKLDFDQSKDSFRLAFPVMSVWFHSFFYSLNSKYGLIFSDFILVLFNFLILRQIFIFLFKSYLLATLSSLAIVSFVFNYISASIFQIFQKVSHYCTDLVCFWPLFFCVLFLCILITLYGKRWLFCAFSGMVLLFFLSMWIGHEGAFVFFQLRYPRPLITESFLFCSLIGFLYSQKEYFALEFKLKKSTFFAGLAGICLGLGGIGNIHSLMIFLITFFLWFVSSMFLYRRFSLDNKLFAWISFFLGFALIFGGNLLWQGMARPDLVSRLGVFRADSLPVLYLDSPKIIGAYIGMNFILFSLIYTKNRHVLEFCFPREETFKREVKLGFLVLLLLLQGSFFALPVQQIFIGKLTSIYHFRDRFWYFFVFIMICITIFLLRGLFRSISRLSFLRRYQTFFVLGVLIVCFCSSLFVVSRVVSRTEHPRDSTLIVTKTFSKSYRGAFFELTSWFEERIDISSQTYSLATFDPLVFSWWRTHENTRSFNVDPFVSSLSMTSIRERFAYFCVLVGMSYEDFKIFIEQFYVKVFWTGSLGISPIESIISKDFSSYELKDRKILNGYTIFDDWELTYKTSDYSELDELYRVAGAKIEKLNLGKEEDFLRSGYPKYVVLLNSMDQVSLKPVVSKYQLVFENDVFRVFEYVENDTNFN